MFSGWLKIATAPTCASASRIRTPGITGSFGKCPLKNGSLYVTHFFPMALLPGSSSSIRSIRRNGCLWGMISIISLISIVILLPPLS